MDPLHKVIIPLQKTVNFYFEIDGKKVDVDTSVFLDTTTIEPALKAKGASLNKGSFKAPTDTDFYQKGHTYTIPGNIKGADTPITANHSTAIGLFYLRFESKAGQYGTNAKPLTCKLCLEKKEIENDPALPAGQGPFQDVNGFAGLPLLRNWLLTDQTPAGTIAHKPNMSSPDKGEVTFTVVSPPPPATPGGTAPTVVQPTFSVQAEVLIQLQVPWPKDFPVFRSDASDDFDWKLDLNGRKALGSFYAIFPLLPEELKKDLREVPFRRKSLSDAGGHMNQYSWEIVIDHEEILNRWPQTIGHHFVHEMAHASNFARCAKAWGQLLPGLATVLLEASSLTAAATAGALIVSGVATVGWTFIIIIVAVEVASALLATKKDFISDWSAASEWQCNHFGWHIIPVIGHLFASLHKTEPNMLFAFPSRKTCSGMAAYFGLENRALNKESNWRKAGFVSDYATSNPIEDFADSFASLMLTENMLRMGCSMSPAAYFPPTPPGGPDPVPNGTLLFMNRQKLIPGSDRETFLRKIYLGGNAPKEIDFDASFRFEELDFDISSVQQQQRQSKEPDKNKAAFLKVQAIINQMQRDWENGSGPLFERNREIMTKLAVPVRENPTPLELLRTLELHGKGWQLYKGKEQAVEKGDLVADTQQQSWMVSVTDEQKRLQQVSGGFSYKKGMKPEDLIKEHSFFKLVWSPAAEKRNWLSGDQKASAYYKDLDAVFTHMIRLWGEQKSPASGRLLSNYKEFLQEWLDIAGIWDSTYPFSKTANLREVLNYLESHGDGLRVFDPKLLKAAPGDLLIPYHRNSLALITRVEAEQQTVDILESGTFDKGPLGEPTDAARMRYAVPFHDFQYYWSPSPDLRKMI